MLTLIKARFNAFSMESSGAYTCEWLKKLRAQYGAEVSESKLKAFLAGAKNLESLCEEAVAKQSYEGQKKTATYDRNCPNCSEGWAKVHSPECRKTICMCPVRRCRCWRIEQVS